MKELEDIETINDILEAENDLFLSAETAYGEAFKNVFEFNDLLSHSIKEVRPDAWVFILFLGQIKKHNMLALLSAVRLHHVQAMLKVRQVLEAGVNAAYGLVHPNKEDFVVEDNGVLTTPKALDNKRRKWLEDNHTDRSACIKNMKDSINKSCAHSSIVYAFNNFSMTDHTFHTPFFDNAAEHWVKTDLWMIGNITMALIDLFYGVNKEASLLTFEDDFIPRLKQLEQQNHKIKAEMEQHPRFKDLIPRGN